jgi:hypothetical protein
MSSEETEIKYKYLLEISYRSGFHFQMWFTKFEVYSDNCKWETAEEGQHVLLLGADHIVSVVQLDKKEI